MSQLQPNLFIENAIRDCVLVFSWDEVLEMRLLCSKKIYSNIYFRKLSVKRYTVYKKNKKLNNLDIIHSHHRNPEQPKETTGFIIIILKDGRIFILKGYKFRINKSRNKLVNTNIHWILIMHSNIYIDMMEILQFIEVRKNYKFNTYELIFHLLQQKWKYLYIRYQNLWLYQLFIYKRTQWVVKFQITKNQRQTIFIYFLNKYNNFIIFSEISFPVYQRQLEVIYDIYSNNQD